MLRMLCQHPSRMTLVQTWTTCSQAILRMRELTLNLCHSLPEQRHAIRAVIY